MPKKSIEISVEKITPRIAEEYLKLNVCNRKISSTKVAEYMTEMTAGRWKVNGIPICFDTNGHLCNGQHRLTACVKSGIAFRTAVARNVESDAFATYDCGLNRTTASNFEIAGVSSSALVASIVNGVNEIRAHGNGLYGMGRVRITSSASIEERNKNPQLYADAANFARKCCHQARSLTPKMIGSLYYYLGNDLKKDARFVEDFFLKITSVETVSPKCLNRLRAIIAKSAGNKKARTSELTLSVYITQGWNAYVSVGENGEEVEPTFRYAENSLPKFI